jgi:hypothetical protein
MMGARNRFGDSSDLPLQECCPYRGLHVRRERLGAVSVAHSKPLNAGRARVQIEMKLERAHGGQILQCIGSGVGRRLCILRPLQTPVELNSRTVLKSLLNVKTLLKSHHLLRVRDRGWRNRVFLAPLSWCWQFLP